MTGFMLAKCPASSQASSVNVSVDLGAGVLDRLCPTRLLRGKARRELCRRLWRVRLHPEPEELISEFRCRLDFLQLGGKPRYDLRRCSRRGDDALPRLP